MAGVVLELGGSGEDSAALPRDAMGAMLRTLLGEAGVRLRAPAEQRRAPPLAVRGGRRERRAGACIDDRAACCAMPMALSGVSLGSSLGSSSGFASS